MRGRLVPAGLVLVGVVLVLVPALAPLPSLATGGAPSYGERSVPVAPGSGTAAFVVEQPLPRFGAAGVTTVANVTVGTMPKGIAYDPASGELFVANYGSNNVSVINDTTYKVVATIAVGSLPGDGPEGVTYDPSTGDVFVTNAGSANVSVLNGTTNTLISTVTASYWLSPVGATFDSRTGLVYVTDVSGNMVYPITRSGPAGVPIPAASPVGAAYDPAKSEVFVSDWAASNVSVVNTTLSRVTKVVSVGPPPPPGAEPEGLGYDSGHGEMFVVDYFTNNVTVINDSTNATVANISLPTPPCFDPITPAYDARTGEVFVTCNSADVIAVINDTNDTAYATVTVGLDPYSDVWDYGHGEIWVTNEGTNNVSVLAVRPASSPTYPVTFSESGLPAGTNWSVTFAGVNRSSAGSLIGFTAANGSYPYSVGGVPGYAASPPAGTVTVSGTKVVVPITWSTVLLSRLSFREVGIGIAGLTWTVTVVLPYGVVVKSNTTYAPPPIVGATGVVAFVVPHGSVTFAVGAPIGWGVASVSGPRVTSFTNVSVKGPSTVAVHFGLLRTVTFLEPPPSSPTVGLPPGTTWGVRLLAGGKDDAPPPPVANTTNASVAFTLPTGGHYGYRISKPSVYRAVPPRGAFTVPAANLTVPILFSLIVTRLVFVETNLPSGTRWGVNITGPVNLSLSGTTPTLSLTLPNGTYAFVAWNFTSLHPHPATGTIVVSPHAAVKVRIRYS